MLYLFFIFCLRESISRQVDKKFRVPKKRGVWNFQEEGGKDKRLFFFSLHSLVLVAFFFPLNQNR